MLLGRARQRKEEEIKGADELIEEIRLFCGINKHTPGEEKEELNSKAKDEGENRKLKEEETLRRTNKEASHIADRRDEVKNLLVKYMQLFKQADDDFPRASRVMREIGTNYHRPIFQTPSRIPNRSTYGKRDHGRGSSEEKYFVSVYRSRTRGLCW
jgi:hypothetical protein